MNFQKLPLKQYAQVQERDTSEAKYWQSFTNTQEHTLQAAVNSIHFSPAESRGSSYIVTGSIKVSLYDAATDKLQRAYSRFQDDAFSGRFRHDGKLIVAGEKTGNVKVFDVKSKALLRQMKGHTSAARATVWTRDGTHLVSGGDDKKAYKWDLATEEAVWSSGEQHSDYIRTVDCSPISSDMFITGGYDHTICLWDSRVSKPVQIFQHDQPITSCSFTPTGAMVLSASGNKVKIWDLLGGGKLIHTFSNHSKDITSLTMDGSSSRILSAGLDGHVKVYSLSTLQVLHGLKFGAPLSAVAVSPDNKKLITGFVSGTVMVQTRKLDGKIPGINSTGFGLSTSLAAAGAESSRHYKGAGKAALQTEDGALETERVARLQPYDKYLKKFSYQKALDAALNTKSPLAVIAVLEELSRRTGLTIALSGRDEESLVPLLAFSARYISNPKYSKLITSVVHKILDMYAGILGHSEEIDELFVKLQRAVKAETVFQRQIARVLGSLDGIISVATMPKS